MLVVLLGALAAAVPLIAQDQQTMTPEEEKSAFVRFVQDRLSTPERQIRISNIEGVLSTTATINEITIADTEGVWLGVVNAAIDWNQRSLLLGRLDVK